MSWEKEVYPPEAAQPATRVEHHLASFRKSLATGRLAHAYLLIGASSGAAGILAERVIALLYCTAPGQRPCGQCAKCRQAAAHALPDAIWVEPQKKSRGILMEHINAVQQHISLTAFEGGWKAVVLQDAERLNREAANHFLKTLEEPPEKCLFLLLSDKPAALLPTVRSRCQRVVLAADESRESAELRSAVIEAMTGVTGQTLAAAVARSRKVLEALKLVRAAIEQKIIGREPLETEDLEDEELEDAALEELEDAGEIEQARIEGLYKEAIFQLLRWLLLWQRDVLLRVIGQGGSATATFPDQEQAIASQAAALTYSAALANVNTIDDMRRQVEQNFTVATVLERGFMRLRTAASV